MDDVRSEPQRRLVEHDELRRAHEAAADREHLLLAARQRPGRLPAALGESREQREHPLAILRALSPGARQHGADLEILVDAERRENLPALGDLADAEIAHAMARQAADLGPAEPDAAASRAMHAGDGLDQRSLAGAVGAHDGDDRSRVDG